MLFVKSKRLELLDTDEFKDKKSTEIISEVGRLWRGMSDEQKQVWVAQSEASKEQYAQDDAAYKANGGAEAKKVRKHSLKPR